MELRNIAIIAHVDHGKTTLVNELLTQCGSFHTNQVVPDRVMDSNALEKERGITILSKNTSIHYHGVKINIVDTPGHADFGGEVERIVKMVDGVLLLVDAAEGPMPQTRFVLKKALAAGLKPVVVINKIDRPDARITEVIDEVLELFIELGANDEQINFPICYASARQGISGLEVDQTVNSMTPLLDLILQEISAPACAPDKPLQMMISSIDYDNYVGRIGVGKIGRGSINRGEEIILCNREGKQNKVKVNTLYTFDGLKRAEVQRAEAGEIVAVSGIEGITIGDTLCAIEAVDPIPFVSIDEPTLAMNFIVNDSPFAGKEGDYVTSRHLRDRLQRELLSNISLRVEEISSDCFKVSGRGELHLSILIETMRREGYEFAVSRPEVILKTVEGILCEPMERLTIEVPNEYVGISIESLGLRRGTLLNMNANLSTTRIDFIIPARGLIGFRGDFLTNTRGNGIMSHVFEKYEPLKGVINSRNRGSLVASETGAAVAYGLYHAQERGALFIEPGTEVYAGMIVGENARSMDIAVNICKTKHLTNTRSSGADEALRLTPPVIMSLEKALEFINDDELLEVTPLNLRLRKSILDASARAKSEKKKSNQ
jgi:GTP-binding protein